MQTQLVLLSTNAELEARMGDAIRVARELAEKNRGIKYEEFAQRLGTTGDVLKLVEEGKIRIGASLLLHAAQIACQPVSTVVGERDLYEIQIPELERQLNRLQEPQILTLGREFD